MFCDGIIMAAVMLLYIDLARQTVALVGRKKAKLWAMITRRRKPLRQTAERDIKHYPTKHLDTVL